MVAIGWGTTAATGLISISPYQVQYNSFAFWSLYYAAFFQPSILVLVIIYFRQEVKFINLWPRSKLVIRLDCFCFFLFFKKCFKALLQPSHFDLFHFTPNQTVSELMQIFSRIIEPFFSFFFILLSETRLCAGGAKLILSYCVEWGAPRDVWALFCSGCLDLWSLLAPELLLIVRCTTVFYLARIHKMRRFYLACRNGKSSRNTRLSWLTRVLYVVLFKTVLVVFCFCVPSAGMLNFNMFGVPLVSRQSDHDF